MGTADLRPIGSPQETYRCLWADTGLRCQANGSNIAACRETRGRPEADTGAVWPMSWALVQNTSRAVRSCRLSLGPLRTIHRDFGKRHCGTYSEAPAAGLLGLAPAGLTRAG